MVKGQRSSGGSATSSQGKTTTQTKRSFQQNEQTCIFVSGDGRQSSRNLTTGYDTPGPVGHQSWHSYTDQYTDQCLPLPTNQDQFSLTDTDYANRQGAISRASQPVSLENGENQSIVNYSNAQYGLQSTLPPSTAWVPNLDAASSWDYGAAVTDDTTPQDMLVTGMSEEGAQGADPWLPIMPMEHNHFDDSLLDFTMDTGIDVTRHAVGVLHSDEMAVLDQLDLSVLNEFCGLPNDLDLIDPMALSPTLVPVQSSELSSSCGPVIAPTAARLPADVPTVLPSPVLPTVAHHGAPEGRGDIADCLQLMKIMKPSKSKKVLPHQYQEEAVVRSNPAPPSLPPVTASIPVAMTPTTPGHPICASASSLLQCSTYTTNAEHVFVTADSATGMMKSPTSFLAGLFRQVYSLASASQCNLQVAHGRCAKLPTATTEGDQLVLRIPKDCVPLKQWREQSPELREQVWVIQEVVNTLASIHAAAEPEYFWGCFSVWVGAKGRVVYLVPDFSELLQKQQDACAYNVNPSIFDHIAVSQLITELVSSCSTRQVLSVALTQKLSDIARDVVGHMTQVARVLGEKRLCRLDVDCCPQDPIKVEIYCLEQEKLQDALQSVQNFLPPAHGRLWAACWTANNEYPYVRSTEMSIPDRKMSFAVVPHDMQQPPPNVVTFIRRP